MPCLTCANWTAKGTPKDIRELGMCRCALGPRWEYLPPRATCPRFTLAPPDVVAARLKWKERADAPRTD
jgi:hypothetical protein